MSYTEFLARYQYDSETDRLGKGGFGTVYKAYDHVRDRFVALKVVEVTSERFSQQKEVELAKEISEHRNIAHYEDCFRYKSQFGVHDYDIMQCSCIIYFLKSKSITLLEENIEINPEH